MVSAEDLRRLAHFVALDWANQLRQNMVAATVFSTVALAAVALLAPQRPLAPEHTALLVLIDPATVGLGFVGAAIFLERSARVIQAIGAAPSPLWVYIASKAMLFGLIGTASGLVVAAAATDFWAVGGPGAALTMFAGLVLSNICAVLFGIGLAAHAPSMNAFLLRAGLITAPLALPPVFLLMRGLEGLGPHAWAIPSAPMTYLFAVGGGAEGAAFGVAASLALLVFWSVLAWRFAESGLTSLLARGGT